jgi:hypothetical protein
MKKELKLDKIKTSNIFIIREPKQLFPPEEIEILK